MRTRGWIAFAALLLPLSAMADTPAEKAEPKTETAVVPAEKAGIEGTWRMVSFRYGDGGALQKVAAGRVMLKHITPGHFTWVDYESKTKAVTRMAGGTFTLQGDAYQETVEYGSGEDIQALLGKGQVFHDTIAGRIWHHQGKLSIGLAIEENWERVS